MTFDKILRAYACGQMTNVELRNLMLAYPALHQWIKKEIRAARTLRETGAIDTIMAEAQRHFAPQPNTTASGTA